MTTLKTIAPFALSLAIIVLCITLFFDNPFQAAGSVQESSEYNATSSITAYANTNSNVKTTTNGGSCALGSVIVASSSGTTFTLKNSTSTSDVSSTTIVTLKAGIAEGTYTFDSVCTRGLGIVMPQGFNGYYVVTWR